MKRTTAARRRLEASRARADTRGWVVTRRERTRQLIELGGLVAKAGIVELAGDDRAVIYGGLLAVADRLRSADGDLYRASWADSGRLAFQAHTVRSDTPK